MTQLRAIKSFYSHEHGGLVTLEDDVLSIVSQVRELTDGRITINLDPDTGWYHLVEHCEDTTDRLVFSVQELDARVVERLRKADSQWAGHNDPYAAAEREQDDAQARIDKAHAEAVMAHGEEMLFHIQKAGLAPYLPKQVFIQRSLNADS